MNSAGPILTQRSDSSPGEVGGVARAFVHEGATVELTPAPPLKRVLAYGVDWGILGVVSYGILLVLTVLLVGPAALLVGFFPDQAQLIFPPGVAVMIAAALLISILLLAYLSFIHAYFVYYHLKRGYTPGKGLFGLKVISLEGKPLTRGQCILREFLVYFDAGFIFPGLISILVTDRGQRLGDLAARTMVTYSKRTEEQGDYLYITQEQYYLLKDTLNPLPVPASLVEDYLRFSYKYFITRETMPGETELSRWESLALTYVPKAPQHGLDQQSVLLYFAEYCFQNTRS